MTKTDSISGRLTLLFLMGLGKAIVYRTIMRNRGMLSLPEVTLLPALDEDEMQILGCRMRRIIDTLFFWHPGPCYYRCFTILYVLRRIGFDIELNFGMKDPFAAKKKAIKAHCWLTYKGQLFLEDERVLRTYPARAAEPKGGIAFWWGDEEKLKAKDEASEK